MNPIPSLTTPTAPDPSRNDEAALRQAERVLGVSRDLEALFTRHLLESGKVGLPGVSGDAPGSEIYADLMRQAIADSAAKNGSLGLARMIQESVSRTGHPRQTSQGTP
jgi:Rod binding domain-containing protein